ncbi:hypothetical protein EVAR_65236_1 [Eumeta japonica]|uniref:Uncharacterized protein n=1 Tax=Eumeta variegata TaxID=151549 RepID=A0A4C1ZLF6_EUMVA|nr:hypothetical protein EVAR_65236_1 [Eumeta japonica]
MDDTLILLTQIEEFGPSKALDASPVQVEGLCRLLSSTSGNPTRDFRERLLRPSRLITQAGAAGTPSVVLRILRGHERRRWDAANPSCGTPSVWSAVGADVMPASGRGTTRFPVGEAASYFIRPSR